MTIEATTLDAVLTENGYAEATVATAVNGDFVPRARYEHTIIRQGDAIDVVTPVTGG